MAKPKDVLTPSEYSNYRNVRAVSVFFVILGSMLALGGIAIAAGGGNTADDPHPIVGVLVGLVGLAGAVGGVATFRGSRKWAKLIYIMAALYLLAFPLGTILSAVMLTGLSGYLESVDRVRNFSEEDSEEPDARIMRKR